MSHLLHRSRQPGSGSPHRLVLVFFLAPLLLSLPLTGQSKPSPRKTTHSLADGLVRQVIEREKIHPPRAASGVEMARGQGPIALLLRKRDGSLAVLRLERGFGDHGAKARPPAADIGEEEEILEEVEEEEEKKVNPRKKPKKRAEGKRGRPVAKPKPLATTPPRLTLHRDAEGVRIRIAPDLPQVKGLEKNGELRAALRLLEKPTPQLNRQAVAAVLRRMRDGTVTTLPRNAGKTWSPREQLILTPSASVLAQDFVTLWEVARATGFKTLMLGTTARPKQLRETDRDLFRSFPKKLQWKKNRLAFDGELLFLLDHELTWRDIEPLIIRAAEVGIWQLGFVVQKDKRTRFKLPLHLPMDR